MRLQMTVVGRRELGANLIGVGRAYGRTALERIVLAGGRPIAQQAAMDAPKDTGFAASTIMPRIVDSGPRHATAAIGPSQEGFYLLFHEIGTSKLPARPFLGPAAESEQRAAVEAMRQEARKIVLSAARTGAA